MSYFPSISQNVIVDSVNSSGGYITINTGTTWHGTTGDLGTSTLGVNAIQLIVKADQPLLVYIDQGAEDDGDGTGTWMVSDHYSYNPDESFGMTVQAVAAYVRVRVQNNSGSNATAVWIETCLCPIVESLPRSLDANQNLKIAASVDHYGFEAENTIQGDQRVAIPTRLAGKQFEFYGGASSAPDSNYWSLYTANSATGVITASSLVLTSGTNSAGKVVITTVRRARYVSGFSMRYRANIRLGDTGIADNTRRWGVCYAANYMFTVSVGTPAIGNVYTNNGQVFTVIYISGASVHCSGSGAPTATGTLTFVQGPGSGNLTYTANVTELNPYNGAWFQLSGTTFSVVTMKNGVVTNSAASGVFNGHIGGTYAPTTDNTMYEIYWTNGEVNFTVDGELLHTIEATSQTWSATPSLSGFADNINSGNTSSVTLNSRSMSVARMGPVQSETTSRYITAATPTLLKSGPGRLICVNLLNMNLNAGAFTLYDSVTNAGNVIGALQIPKNAALTPTTLTFDLPFHNGLYVDPAVACQVVVTYE